MFNQIRVSGYTGDKASVQHRGDTVSDTPPVSTAVFDPVFDPVFTVHVSCFASDHSLERVGEWTSV